MPPTTSRSTRPFSFEPHTVSAAELAEAVRSSGIKSLRLPPAEEALRQIADGSVPAAEGIPFWLRHPDERVVLAAIDRYPVAIKFAPPDLPH